MLEVSHAVRHPDGRSPVLGDQDSGRILPAGFSRPATHDNLLDLGASCLGLPRWRDELPHEEVAWTLGVASWEALAQWPVRADPVNTAFTHGGLYVLDGGGAHLVARWGGVGQNGNGGHAHNDLSSYELSYGTPVIVDSGTYAYTGDVAARNAFRSAAAHNVLVVDRLEMHPFRADEPFRMPAHARFEIEGWDEASEHVSLTGSHDGFRRAGDEVRCRRQITLDRQTGVVEIADEAEGHGRHLVESLVHLAPGLEASTSGSDGVSVRSSKREYLIGFTGHTSLAVESGWVSSEYGVREPAAVVRASVTTELPAVLSYKIIPR
jgi:uncharacterized heparinase superfamily protein